MGTITGKDLGFFGGGNFRVLRFLMSFWFWENKDNWTKNYDPGRTSSCHISFSTL